MQQYLFDETRDQPANVFCLFHAERSRRSNSAEAGAPRTKKDVSEADRVFQRGMCEIDAAMLV